MESLDLLISILMATLKILLLLFAISFTATALFITIVTLWEHIHESKRISSANKENRK